jgi:N-acetyl-anhydromuramyl-L-alanine amidase AmpD
MSETWYPQAVRLPIATHEYFNPRAVPTISIVEHITAGADSRHWLQFADNQSSVHFLIRVENGRGVVYQFMPLEFAAWGNGRYSENNPFMPQWVKAMIAQGININHATISIEHEGVVPTASLYTGPMLEADLALNKWIADTVPTIKRDREHIIGHYQIDAVSRANCPGGPGGKLYPFDTILAALNAPAAPQSYTFPETNVTVAADFYAFWARNGGVEIFGYPIRAEKDMLLPNGQTIRVQSFERWRMERHPDGIKGGLVEVERLNLAHE